VRKHGFALSLMLTIPFMGLLYTLLNVPNHDIHNLHTTIDHLIPFIKVFIVPYMLWMPFLYITLFYFCLKDRKLYYHTLIAYNLSVFVSYIVYMTFKTTVERPELEGHNLLTQLTTFLYQADQPYNCFPSIHCMSSYLLFSALIKSQLKNKFNLTLIGLASVTIILSTLFIKQHVIWDAVGGILLAEAMLNLVRYLQWERLLDMKLSQSVLQED
jgi:membrane-associated phospholipid phosphatase